MTYGNAIAWWGFVVVCLKFAACFPRSNRGSFDSVWLKKTSQTTLLMNGGEGSFDIRPRSAGWRADGAWRVGKLAAALQSVHS
jgi:hypothetical protein